ncbi:hypothetical protein HNY73_019198 [Argiope bruennichi]|uniref:Uncharacterized protein n=1 Tax=Argiope bruennichi TaxID=94029 RepID=A0A8T0EKF5_ARGBR|nr:hypothetical protein HNY73_019198 [Argiope bruennichi]
MVAVLKVLQSKTNIKLDESFEIDIVTVKRPVVAERNRKVYNIEFDRIKKRLIICVPYDLSDLCCAKALVLVLAHLEKIQQAINALRDLKKRPALKNRVQELHRSAGVPLGLCTFKEVALFENHLDVQFIAGWLLQQGIAPDVIPNGSKLMSIKHSSLDIAIIHWMRFLLIELSEVPSCFGFTELKKGYFPDLFNLRENQNYVGSFPRQHSDVDILRRCCLILFREEFLKIADVGPFQYLTIASDCMAAHRKGHIKDDTIAIVPTHVYSSGKNYSPDAIVGCIIYLLVKV